MYPALWEGRRTKNKDVGVALSLLDDILSLCYRRSTTLESRERAFQIKKITGNLLTRMTRKVDYTYIDDSTGKLYKKVRREVSLVSHKPVSQISHKTQRYKGDLVTTFLSFWR